MSILIQYQGHTTPGCGYLAAPNRDRRRCPMPLDGNRYTVGVTRRELFEILAAASAAALSASAGYAAETTVRLTPLFEDVTIITGAGGNMLVHRTSDGLLLIDSGLAESTGAVRFTIKGFSPQPHLFPHQHSLA